MLKEGLQDFYASILDEVTLTGFLYKRGHSMLKSNKSRWFVLTPDKFTYYVSSGYREKKGEVVLNSEAKVSSIPDKGSNKCRFLVTCGQTKKEFEQTAPDQRTRQAWISAIQTAIGITQITIYIDYSYFIQTVIECRPGYSMQLYQIVAYLLLVGWAVLLSFRHLV